MVVWLPTLDSSFYASHLDRSAKSYKYELLVISFGVASASHQFVSFLPSVITLFRSRTTFSTPFPSFWPPHQYFVQNVSSAVPDFAARQRQTMLHSTLLAFGVVALSHVH